MSQIDERLLELTTENEQLKAEVAQLKKDKESLQVDYANKIAIAKVDFESKELEFKKTINQLQKALETRTSVNDQINKDKPKKTVNQMYEEILGK